MSASRRQAGFTLVELLVVITIIGILMSMLMPAVTAVRERARQTDCSNRIHQLAIAMNSYLSSNQVFPMNWGYTDTTGVNTVGHSWLALILPQLDMKPMWDQIKFGQKVNFSSGTQNSGGYKNNLEVALMPIPLLRCPSDIGNGTAMNQAFLPDEEDATTNYKAVNGSNWTKNAFVAGTPTSSPIMNATRGRNGNIPDKSNKVPGDIRDYGNGLMPRGGNKGSSTKTYFATSDAAISDGMSNTFAVGESVPAFNSNSAWYSWDGAIGTCGLPLNYQYPNHRREDDAGNWTYSYGFFSRHAAGANFAFCDAHVQFINEGVDPTIYRALGSIGGGEVVQRPE